MTNTQGPLETQKTGGPKYPRTPPATPKGSPVSPVIVSGTARWTVPAAAQNGAYLFVRSSNVAFIATAAGLNSAAINPWPQPTPQTADVGGSTVTIGQLVDPAAMPNPLPSGLVWTYLALPPGAVITIPSGPAGQIPADALFWFAAA